MKKILLINFLTIITGSQILNAQFKITNEFRTRAEYRNGYKSLRDSASIPAFITTQRSRVGLNYKNKKLTTCFSIQDVRVWGETKHKNDLASIDVHEAWFEIPANEMFKLKIGRQELKYDDQRLLSANNWNNVNASHDLLLFKFNKNDWKTHLGLAYNNEKEVYFESNYTLNYYKTLSFLWCSRKINQNMNLSAIAIADGHQKSNNQNIIYIRAIYGGNLNYKNDSIGLQFNGTGYMQSGHDKSGNTINAWLLHFKAGYSLIKKMTILGGIDYFSGNDFTDTVNNENNAFSNLYGSGHRFLGYMDYFRDVDKHTSGAGLSDIYGQIEYKINKKLVTQLTYHWFSLTGKLLDPEHVNELIPVNNELGYEADLLFKYKYNDHLSLDIGYSMLQAKETMSILKGGQYKKTANWIYLMFTAKL